VPTTGQGWYKNVAKTTAQCVTQSDELYVGFMNNCSSSGTLQATITLKTTNFCDEDKKSFFAVLFWLLVIGGLCCCGVCLCVCYRLVNGAQEDERMANMGFQRGANGGYMARERDVGQFDHGDPTKPNDTSSIQIGVVPTSAGYANEDEWQAAQELAQDEYDAGDERNRIKAMRWERKREEKRLARLQEQNSDLREEQEVWTRTADDRAAEGEELERKRRAAREAESEAEKAQRLAEEAVARGGGGSGSGGDSKILSDAAADIKKHVEEAHQLPAAEKKKKLRDLRMRWHPDKNPMLRGLADEISKIINTEIERCRGIYGE